MHLRKRIGFDLPPIQMNFKLFFFLLFIIPHVLIGQDYSDYYRGINKGKLLAAKNDIEGSLNSYYLTFEQFDFVFARDCYNAIELSCYAKDSIKIDYFIRRGIKQGLNLDQITKINAFSAFLNSDFLKSIEKDKIQLENSYAQKINWSLRDTINHFFTQDQAIRERYYKAFLFKRIRIGREWEELIKTQVEKLIEITKVYGFPGEKLIGIDIKEMHPKIGNSNLSAGMPIVIFIHHYSQPNKSNDSLLFQQISTGYLYNEHFATICDFEAKFGKNKYDNYGYFAFKHSPKTIDENEINRRRNEISLPSINEFKELYSTQFMTKFWNRLY